MKYTITNIREMRQADLDGKLVDLTEIRFEIADKYRGSVILPSEGFSEAVAKKAVRKKVLELKALMEFEGDV